MPRSPSAASRTSTGLADLAADIAAALATISLRARADVAEAVAADAAMDAAADVAGDVAANVAAGVAAASATVSLRACAAPSNKRWLREKRRILPLSLPSAMLVFLARLSCVWLLFPLLPKHAVLRESRRLRTLLSLLAGVVLLSVMPLVLLLALALLGLGASMRTIPVFETGTFPCCLY